MSPDTAWWWMAAGPRTEAGSGRAAPRLLRTSSFRLTLLYAAVFSTSVLILFGVMLWAGPRGIDRQIDATVANEIAEVTGDAAGGGLPGLERVVRPLAAGAAPGIYYLLEDAEGRVLAGNLPPMAPVLGIRELHPAHIADRRIARAARAIRGRGVRTAGGGYLFVGVDSFQTDEMRELITRSFLWVLGATIVLALVGGAVTSLGLLRRVEAISRLSRAIVAGDLSRRIALRGSNDEFDHLSVSLNTMLDRIEALMAGLRQVSADIAHDLRTPLTRLRQRLELARRRATTVEALQQALDGAIGEVDTILETFGALLRIAQIEAGAARETAGPVDLSVLAEGVADAYLPAAEEKGQTLAAAIAPGLAVRGDRELLTQMLANLVENAVRHAPPGAAIRLEATARDGAAELVVADTGPGIPEPLREKVFQRFFRLDQSRTTPGTGLGLSLVAAVAGLHGIALRLEDNRPGLRVVMRFP
jgi:signal transduction histidine kinase